MYKTKDKLQVSSYRLVVGACFTLLALEVLMGSGFVLATADVTGLTATNA